MGGRENMFSDGEAGADSGLGAWGVGAWGLPALPTGAGGSDLDGARRWGGGVALTERVPVRTEHRGEALRP